MCQFLLVLYYFFLVHVGPLQSPGWALQSPGLFQKSFLLFYLSVLLVFVHIFRTSVLQMLVSPLLSGILYKRSHFCSFVPCAWWYLLCVLQLMLLTALLIFLLLLRWYLLLWWFYLFCMLLLLLFQHLPPPFLLSSYLLFHKNSCSLFSLRSLFVWKVSFLRFLSKYFLQLFVMYLHFLCTGSVWVGFCVLVLNKDEKILYEQCD